jgi:hypothetical protein
MRLKDHYAFARWLGRGKKMFARGCFESAMRYFNAAAALAWKAGDTETALEATHLASRALQRIGTACFPGYYGVSVK